MSVSERTRPTALAALTTWRARQWAVTAAAALGCVVLIGVPTDLIETPLFSRAVPPTWWSYPVLAVSALLAGLLVATYVNGPTGPGPRNDGRWGSFGGALTFFAVGCPVCNKVVLFALAPPAHCSTSGPCNLSSRWARWPCWPVRCASGSSPPTRAPSHPNPPGELPRSVWQHPPAPRRCRGPDRAVRTGRARCSRR